MEEFRRQAFAWRDAQLFREFIEAMRPTGGVGEDWLEWAEGYVMRLDPVGTGDCGGQIAGNASSFPCNHQ